MVKSGLENFFLKFNGGLQRYLLTCQANSAFLGRLFCTGQQQLWRPSWNLKIFFSRPLFTIIFKPKMMSNLCKNFLCIVWHQKPTVGSIFQFIQNIIKVNSNSWLLTCSSNMTLSLSSYTGSALKRELHFCNGYPSLLYFCCQLLPARFANANYVRLLQIVLFSSR